ncbi:DUF2975 domain-containing protein [Caldalkalibacillus mannanilyticus]|uniref:DUF2975 domain-containing protein n=1 Tax=Caldalkalibacillus mannanilyticus TaxID=1418 RepID=UPI00046A5079|nr:DUF2975 domain-containing protein [Caldalkalibacillus mannanilyticus]
MKRETFFLKVVVFLLGMTGIALCLFWLPWLANREAEMNPELAYLQYPILIGIYVTAIPFFGALYQALKLLSYIDKNIAFSDLSVKALKIIKNCGITISILYVGGISILLLLVLENASLGIVVPGLVISIASIVIAVFAAVLQKLLKQAIDIKSENDLTI